MGHIQDYFTGKTVLLTGATGLVGKVLVEKVLRDLPTVRRLYVLIRPRVTGDRTVVTAVERLWQEVLASSAFDPLRQRHGDGFTSLAREKVAAVAGDLSEDGLGLDAATYRRLQEEVQVIINCAAMVTFDAPLNAALRLNTLGPRRVLEFARGCDHPLVVHVSTCYVNGTRQGPIPEEPLDPRQTVGHLRGVDHERYDVDEEVQALQGLVERVKGQARRAPRRLLLAWSAWRRRKGDGGDGRRARATRLGRLRREWVTRRLVAEGMQWARRRGWNDTYTFTKAMGEQMVVRYRGDLPTLIVRPSIIESGMEAPQPGWMDGFRMLDPLIVAYGRDRLPDFPGLPESTLDVMPADAVVNALLASIPWAHRQGGLTVCHIASGMENPMTVGGFVDLVQEYFRREPLLTRPRALPHITFPSRGALLRRLRYRYLIPLRALELAASLAFITPWGRRLRRTCRSRRAALDRLTYYIRIYGPYAEVRCQYLTHHLRQVWESLSPEERARFNFDMTTIDWRRYIQGVHIPGIKRFLLGMSPEAPAAEPAEEALRERVAALEADKTVDASEEGEAGEQEEPTQGTQPLPHATSPSPGPTSGDGVGQGQGPSTALPPPQEGEVQRWLKIGRLGVLVKDVARGLMGLGFRYYLGFRCEGLEHVPDRGPFIIVSNHASHLDTAAILVALGKRSRQVHPMAATDYWFRRSLHQWFVRACLGAIPFDRETRVAESLGLATAVLQQRQALIFFPEGGRSATGVMQPFKRGIGLLVLASGAPVIPARTHGTFYALPKGRGFLRRHPVRVRFGPLISPEAYLHECQRVGAAEMSRRISADLEKAVEALV